MCKKLRPLASESLWPGSSTKALNHEIIAFMSVTHVKIIANVPRVTSGKVGNGAIYKF